LYAVVRITSGNTGISCKNSIAVTCGIFTSINSRSIFPCCKTGMASCTLRQHPAMLMSLKSSIYFDNNSRAYGSSSTSKQLIIIIPVLLKLVYIHQHHPVYPTYTYLHKQDQVASRH